MIAIIDSGSTKSDWRILDKKGKEYFSTRTIGLNPYFLTAENIESEIRKNTSLLEIADKISHIFFYGAGCSAPKYISTVKLALDKIFPKSTNLVEHDLAAAAYACYREKPVIACILGTGSNSCFFDGENIREETPSLAFILGDEGSGSYIGKRVLRYYFLKKMKASSLRKEFQDFIEGENIQWEINRQENEKKIKFSEEKREKLKNQLQEEYKKLSKVEREYQIFSGMNKNVYNNPFANTYLASFNRFVKKHKNEPFFHKIIYDSIRDFILNQILVYPEARHVELNFIGSIAHFYEDILVVAAAEFQLKVGEIIQKPIEKLVNYHINHILPKLGI